MSWPLLNFKPWVAAAFSEYAFVPLVFIPSPQITKGTGALSWTRLATGVGWSGQTNILTPLGPLKCSEIKSSVS